VKTLVKDAIGDPIIRNFNRFSRDPQM